MKRTLEVLERCFNKDLIEVMVRVSSYGDENDWVKKVACGLYLLTYDNRISDVDEICKVLCNKDEFKSYYKSCRNKLGLWRDELWHKRLWAALRDYLKSDIHDYIKKRIEELRGRYEAYVLDRWDNPHKYLDQLEVPGDRWNERFYEYVMKPILKRTGKGLNGRVSRVIRQLYEYHEYHDVFKAYGFYPEQFDVTFDFARLFCDRNLCSLCPLSSEKENIRRFCIGDKVTKNEKYCPILALLGYLQPCSPENCPVYEVVSEGKTLGLCKIGD